MGIPTTSLRTGLGMTRFFGSAVKYRKRNGRILLQTGGYIRVVAFGDYRDIMKAVGAYVTKKEDEVYDR